VQPLSLRNRDFPRFRDREAGMLVLSTVVKVHADILPPRYRGPQQIGRGAMGDIYRATDSTLGRAVAIKILVDRYAEDDAVRQRFTREALAAARVSGEPNTVTIYDVGEHNERPYIVMEYLSGGSLDDLLRREGAQPPPRVFEWLEQAARALDAAHREGLVHRDVKPGNLMLDREGNVHVADFGIASAAGMDSLTMTGTVLGTAGYLSPEQAQGDRATPASDRYALAVVAFELLTGERPFEAESPTAEASAHVHADVPSVSARKSTLPSELDPVFRRALAKDPARRYESCAEFVAALRAAVADAAGSTTALPPVSPPARPAVPQPMHASRSAWPVLGGLLLLGIVAGALVAYLLTRGGSDNPQRAAIPQPKATTVVRTVTRASGETTTVQQTVTTSPAPPAPVPSGTSGHALNDQAYAKMGAGDYVGALPLLRQAVEKLRGVGPNDPYEGFANYNLGYTLLQLEQCSEAIPYLQRAQQLEPQRSEPPQALARAKACA
jgi:eukaryotic-like serine/threonine-protein kinase